MEDNPQPTTKQGTKDYMEDERKRQDPEQKATIERNKKTIHSNTVVPAASFC